MKDSHRISSVEADVGRMPCKNAAEYNLILFPFFFLSWTWNFVDEDIDDDDDDGEPYGRSRILT